MQKCFLLHLLVSGTGVSFFCFFAVIPTVYTKVWQKEGLSKTGNPKPLLELWTSSEAQSLAGGPSADYALASCTIEDARPPPGLHGARRVYLISALALACSPKA